MSLYDDASLIMYPSGVKSGKIYSQKPTDGTGDLTFTRASTATRVNSSGLIESVASGVPRIDYLNGCGQLLLEPQRTNLITYSQDFTTWSKTRSVITLNSTTSPDGTVNATKVECSVSGSSNISSEASVSFVSGTSYTVSFFCKYGNTNRLRYAFSGGVFSSVNIVFYPLNGTIESVGAGVTDYSITNFGNGWYRYTITGVANATVSNPTGQMQIYNTGTNEGTLDDYHYYWGAQLEAGSYATSYIPTAGSTVTRLADEAKKGGISSLIGQSEGTLFFDGYCNSNAEIISINRGSINSVFLYSSSGNVRAFVYSDSTGLNLLSSVSCLTRFKAAVAYKSNSIAFYVNGTLITQNTSTTFTPNVTMENFYIAQGEYVQGKNPVNCNQAIIFPTRLTNAELISLTTL